MTTALPVITLVSRHRQLCEDLEILRKFFFSFFQDSVTSDNASTTVCSQTVAKLAIAVYEWNELLPPGMTLRFYIAFVQRYRPVLVLAL